MSFVSRRLVITLCGGRRRFASVSGSEQQVSTVVLLSQENANGGASKVLLDVPDASSTDQSERSLTPSRVVDYLEKHIVGQLDAKRAIAVALRNRWRRRNVSPKFLRNEISPKNMLLVGPTGVGKTEIARRIAALVDAPFVKVEATSYTEVGFHGRDVDSMIQDLVGNAMTLAKTRLRAKHKAEIDHVVEQKLLGLLTTDSSEAERLKFLPNLRAGELDDTVVECVVDRSQSQQMKDLGGSAPPPGVIGLEGLSSRSVKLSLRIADCRRLLTEQELSKRANDEAIKAEALRLTQEHGIVFIDEIDKVCYDHSSPHRGGDASNEGVQRDLLPLVEGTTVETKFGTIDTSKILFIASGAFHAVKVSDLLPELQGRFPVRVQLNGLSESDFYRILTEPVASILRQHVALFDAEGLRVTFTECGTRRIAELAFKVNSEVENIGARRLHTILEKILEPVSFDADKLAQRGETITIDKAFVDANIGNLLQLTDLKKFIL
jgi:ATP-dependent HslUV protease ATP-binding subunit HslU